MHSQMNNYVGFIHAITNEISTTITDNGNMHVLLLQLHGIESINKNISYHEGNECCNLITNKLFGLLHKNDIVYEINQYRYGIIFHHISTQTKLIYIINQLLAIGNKFLEINGRKFKIDFTIGASVFPDHSSNAEELLRLAEISLDQAIEDGLNYKIATYKDKNAAIRSTHIEHLIHTALEEMELEVLYQPKIGLQDRSVKSMEALLRWNSKSLGEISPSVFIPIVEKTPLIMEITEFLIKRVCNDRNNWPDQFKDLKVAVNVPIDALRSEDIIGMLTQSAAIWDLDYANLIFEITERSVIPTFSESSLIIRKLKELGIQISIDDFGVEYSSLSCLKEIAPDEIKIDKIFVSKVSTCRKTYELVSAIVKIAEIFGSTTVAEGVEDIHTLEVVASLGCDLAQGYYISKALSADRLVEWYQEYHLQQHTDTGCKKPLNNPHWLTKTGKQ